MPLKAKNQLPQQPAAPDTNAVVSADIREVKPPMQLAGGWAWIGWALLIALLGAIAAAAWLRLRRRTATKTEIQVPPHIVARDQLRAALALIGQPEPFCVAVSQVIRVYLEQQFKLRAPERTTEEFLAELQSSALLALDQKRSLANFLSRCDLVKFARYEPGEPELRDLYDAAVRLVEEAQWSNPAPVDASPGPVEAGGPQPAVGTAGRI